MADVSKVKLNGTAYNVKDASVPSWAKQSSKPSYTQDEVGDGSTYKRVSATEKSTWNSKGTYSKPSGGIPKSDLASVVQTSLEKADSALQSFTESDPTVPSWAKASSKPSYTASEVGAIATSAKGAANGVASLDSAGKVPSSQLPSYVDDVLEYSAKSSFPSTGETGKIYVDTSTNKTYRWSGSAYVEISASLALGETDSTAYPGNKGKTAYEHATDSSRLTTAQSSGLYKIATTAQGHIASVTAVAKSDITNLGIPGSDTNTHRPIQVNGTQVLGDNTTALNLKAGSNVSLSNSSGTVTIAATDTTYSVVSTSGNGLAPKVTDTSKFLKGDGTWATPANTWTAMVGATSSSNGSVGYVNATPPKDGYNTKYLRADGAWVVPPNTTYSAATQSANGLMSSTDKTKLDGIATGATANIGTVTQVQVGSTAYNPSSGVISLPAYPSDTNTHRPIQMNGTEILGNNTTALNLKAGSNVSLSNSSGTVTIAATDTTYSSKSAASGGTDVSLVTTGEKYTWNSKGTYSKPSGGIPKSDLASSVQTSLGKADSALQSHQTIKQDGITGATVNRFGTCSIAAGTAAKTVSITTGTFALEAGARVTVKFSNANTASSPTLNVNSTGAKNIFHKGAQITTGTNKGLLAGTVDFIYDGTQWHLIGNYINTTYSTATPTTSGLMSATDKTVFNAHLNNPNKNLVSDPFIHILNSGTYEITPFNPNLQAGTYVITCKYTSSATAQFKLYYTDDTEENLGNAVPIGTNATFTEEFSISKPVKLLKLYSNGTFISSYGNFMVCSKTDWTINNSIVVPCSRILCMDDSFVLNDLVWRAGSKGQYYTDDLTTNITQSVSGVMAVTIKDMLMCRTTDVLIPNARYGGKIGFLSNTNSFESGATVLVRVCGWL